MFEIHKSFTKYDLINIADNLKLNIVYSTDDDKSQIKRKVIECIQNNMGSNLNENNYNLDSIRSLMLYLKKENPNKRLSSKDKDSIITISKKIIHYCKNDYNLDLSYYDDEQSILDDLYGVKRYGDILSVRIACKLWNKQSNKIKFNPIISPAKKKLLDEKNKLKNINNKLVINSGTFILDFD